MTKTNKEAGTKTSHGTQPNLPAGVPHVADKRIQHQVHQGEGGEHSLGTMGARKPNDHLKPHAADLRDRRDAQWEDDVPNNAGYAKR